MRFVWDMFGIPALFAGILVFAVFGTYRGTAVQDDFTWLIGGLVWVGGILLQSRWLKLRAELEALEQKVEGLEAQAKLEG